ncbi:hypothetical protein C7441_101135 [Pseudaminobacter salicylatoxidans]|uniref:Uncharacterized protein n=1 Tax=Pseudaminobacter salicylatoxidans TaxID=93369 RepID=A0A316CB00_PSESE|nr:hypothetical protein [Pseudaminobacter salicylatoxidans]PWJ86256.1 hypothetical protein C7441_101135 [Pseudaminobacter salicylatoxidans]
MPRPPASSREERTDREDIAFLVPFFGVVLLSPPLLNLFADLRLPFGVPFETAYLFGVWILVIAGAILLSRARQFREGTPRTDAENAAPSVAEPPEST